MERKRGELSTIDVTILDNKIEKSSYASVVFINSIKKIISIIGSDIFLKNKDSYNGPKFLAYNIDDFSKYIKSGSIKKLEDFYITTHSSTNDKKIILESIFNFHNIEGKVNIISRNYKKTKLYDIDQVEIDDYEEDYEDNYEDNYEVTPPSSSTRIRKFNTEDELSKVQAQAEFDDEVQSFKRFKAIETDIPRNLGKNPIMDAICILGDSGAGKSYTIENILENENHEFKFIIPTASATGLLSQFSPSENKYILSKLGEMLIESAENPNKLYTVVFDEFHKPSTIEMINDELLQAISTKRNRFRFISLDSETINLYKNSKLEFIRGNIKIPDNFGFIFISSKPKVIANNPDLFRRLDFIYIKEDDRDIKTINQLLSRKINKEERDNLLNIREDQ